MKRFLSIFLAIFALSFAACTNSEEENGGNSQGGGNKPSTQPEVTIITQPTPTISAKGGNDIVAFHADKPWSAKVLNTRADGWCSIYPTSGAAGDVQITITTTPNDATDDRTATIVIQAGSTSISITITQKQADALTVTASKFEVDAEGGEVEIEVKANVDYDYTIDPDAAGWVKYKATRALESSTLVFEVAENEDMDKREAQILIHSGDLEELVTIYQEGNEPTIILSKNEYTVSDKGETVAVEVKSNVDVAVEIPSDVDWISENATRAMSTNTFYLDIDKNDSYDSRSAEVKFINNNDNLSESVVIVQLQKDAIILAKSEYEMDVEGGDLEFEIQTNVNISVTISATAQNWISQTDTRGLESKVLRFHIEPCSSNSDREGVITISGGNITQNVVVKQSGLQEILKMEREALIAFYKATDGDNWMRNDNWCSEKPVGEWYGVGTDETGLVWIITLNENNLTGAIPESIGNLRNLRNINLDMNNLSGEIPASIGNLTELNNLCAINNSFTGNIPESIGNLRKLNTLYLDSNQLSGELPASIGNLTDLRYFMVGYNNLTGSIPESISNMTNLQFFYIRSNFFTGKLPSRLLEMDTWPTGWHEILDQRGEGFSKEGLTIPAPKFVETTIDGDSLDFSVYSDNEYTILYHYFDWCHWSYDFTPILVELYNGYKNKGVEVVAFSGEGTIESHRNFAETFNTTWPYITLSDNKDLFNAHTWISPGVSVVDKDGYIVFNNLTDDYRSLGDFLLEKLGPPDSSGTPDLPQLYESTDYSKDGEVKQLQSATEGKGIDIILMGDAFTDRLIADGSYDNVMQTAMELFFTVEPYKSLRDHFNVYSVTAVSKNEIYSQFSDTAFKGFFDSAASKVGGNDSIVFSYALKAIGEDRMDADQATMIVIMNSEVYAGTCYMYIPSMDCDWSNGVSVSYFPIGSAGEESLKGLIHHEAWGHGFAKLADEYTDNINTVTEDDVRLISSEQARYGWWKNVDFTNDLSQIRWNYFLDDPRYANDGLGAFEGGLTYLNGVWRPSLNSIMRYNTGGFNAPSREAIYYRIHKLAYGESWQYDYEKFVEWDAKNRKTAATRGVPYRIEQPKNFKPLAPPIVINHTWREAR